MNLRGTYKKSYFREINKQLIVIGLIFLTAVVIGTYLNKMWPDYQGNIVNSINPIVEYYSSKISIKNIVLANLKSDISFMMYISLSTLFVVTFPITLILFIVKGISMGYTINSVILAMKLKSIKFILITTFKNLIIILGTIILILISINYIKEIEKVYEDYNIYKVDCSLSEQKNIALNQIFEKRQEMLISKIDEIAKKIKSAK